MFGLDLQAKTYQLAWDPSASPDVVGYRIYIAELGKDPGEPLAAGMECTKAVELIPGRTYAIRATSVGADDIESEPGDTLTYSCPVELEAAAIVVQPKSAVAARNGSILLEVTAAGASPLRYQWFFNDLALPGQSARTCQISQLQPASQGRYSVVVSNPAGSVRSADAVVTVAEAPVITGGPQSLVADLWAPAVFNVTVGGTGPFGYQWERSGTRLLGANEATLTLPSVGPGDVGAYRVTVTNLSGKAVSGLATLAIRLPPRILSQPQNLSVPQKTPVVLRVRADGDETLAYQWFQNDRPVGSNSSDLVLGAVQTNAAGIYRVVVSNRLGIATSSDISLWVKAPPVITLPAVPAVDEGQPFVITPVLQGWQPMTVRWLKDGRLLPNETNPVLHVSNAQESDGGYYTVEATNMDGTGRSAACSVVIFTAPRFTSLPVSQVVTNGKSIVFSAAARGGAPLSYQWFFEGSAIPKATTPRLTIPGAQLAHEGVYSLTISNRLGTATSPRVSLRVSYPPVITLQPLPLTIAQDASATFVAAATGRGPLSFAWSLNGQTIPGAIGNSFTVPDAQSADAGSYQVTVTNPDGVRSSQPALLRVIARPVITEEPADQALVTGEQLVLKVSVSTEVPCTYQWYLNGVALPGSNKPVLTFYNIQANHSGAYQLAINNFTGVVRSRIVAVTVTDAAAAKAANSVNLQSNLDGLTLGGERDAGGRWVLTVRGQPGQSYDLEGTSDLRTWESLGTVSSESGVSRLVDPASTGQPLRLYRVRTRQAALR